MKFILENWHNFLLLETIEVIWGGQNLIIFPEFTKDHIKDSHKQAGKGSVFTDFDLNIISDAVQNLDINTVGRPVANCC